MCLDRADHIAADLAVHDDAVASGGNEALVAGHEADRVDLVFVVLVVGDLRERIEVPKMYGLVDTGRQQLGAVVGDGEIGDPHAMPFELALGKPGLGIEDAD